jgi:hypothetical protein
VNASEKYETLKDSIKQFKKVHEKRIAELDKTDNPERIVEKLLTEGANMALDGLLSIVDNIESK